MPNVVALIPEKSSMELIYIWFVDNANRRSTR